MAELTPTFEELSLLVYKWADERELLKPEYYSGQANKVHEEILEAEDGFAHNNQKEMIDGIGDVYVTLLILAFQQEVHPLEVIHIDGTFSEWMKKELGQTTKIQNTRELFWNIRTGVVNTYKNINKKKPGWKNHVLVSIHLAMKATMRLAVTHGLSPEACLHTAYQEIANRKGKVIDGTFVKQADLEG